MLSEVFVISNRTSDKKSGEYAAIHLKIVLSNTLSIIFI